MVLSRRSYMPGMLNVLPENSNFSTITKRWLGLNNSLRERWPSLLLLPFVLDSIQVWSCSSLWLSRMVEDESFIFPCMSRMAEKIGMAHNKTLRICIRTIYFYRWVRTPNPGVLKTPVKWGRDLMNPLWKIMNRRLG